MWLWRKHFQSLWVVNYVDIEDIYPIICRQDQRDLNTYKWLNMGVPMIEILIVIVFSHLEPLTMEGMFVKGHMVSSDRPINNHLTMSSTYKLRFAHFILNLGFFYKD